MIINPLISFNHYVIFLKQTFFLICLTSSKLILRKKKPPLSNTSSKHFSFIKKKFFLKTKFKRLMRGVCKLTF